MEGKKPRPSVSTSAASAAEIIAHNEDLLKEILIHLPAKSLIRFKSVSKLWLSVICATSFSRLHTLRHHGREPQSSFILRAYPREYFYFNPTSRTFLPFHFNSTETTILQSCHGLLLLRCSKPNTNYYVYNPATRQSRNLLIDDEFYCRWNLAYDPLESPHYKVVCVRMKDYILHECDILVYDSETHKWERFETNYDPELLARLKNGLYWKNCIYWLTNICGLLCFDMETGSLKPFYPIWPINYEGRLGVRGKYLMESSGHVHFVAHNNVMNSLVVYKVLEQNHNWLMVDYVDCYQIIASFGDKICVIGIVRGEDEEKWSLVFHVPGRIMVYGFDDGSVEELIDLRRQEFYREDALQFGYHETYQFIDFLNPFDFVSACSEFVNA